MIVRNSSCVRSLVWGIVAIGLTVFIALPVRAADIDIRPVTASGVEGTDWVSGPGLNEITLFSGDMNVAVEIFITNLEPDNVGAYQFGLDCNFDFDVAGTIDPSARLCGQGLICQGTTNSCTIDEDCTPPARCIEDFRSGECLGVNDDRNDYVFAGQVGIAVCNNSDLCPSGNPGRFICGAVLIAGAPGSGPGDHYGATFGFAVSGNAKGSSSVDIDLDPGVSLISDIDGVPVPIGSVLAGRITVEIGVCCGVGGAPLQCLDGVTVGECNAAGGCFTPGGTCSGVEGPIPGVDSSCPNCDDNIPDEIECNDDNACTADTCGCSGCENADTTPVGQCCAPTNGLLTTIEDGDSCTDDICNADGSVSHPPAMGGVDCNGNGISDLCDIAACDPLVDPACDDCNLNEIPDSCDIAGGTSQDTNVDGIPDECTNSNPEATNNWTDGANWPLGSGYPDSDQSGQPGGVPNLHVTVDDPTTAILLNEDVTVDSLRILTGATLQVTSQDSGIPNDPLDGDLTIAPIAGPPGDLLIQHGNALAAVSQLLVSNSRIIDVSAGAGVVTIGPGGVYRAIGNTGKVSAGLNAGSIAIQGGPLGGLLQADQDMEISITGNLTLRVVGAGKGNSTPPCLVVTGTAGADVGGDFGMLSDADVLVSSVTPLTVGGDFVNLSRDPLLFDWLGGAIDLTGVAQFEVAGRDLGPVPAGFVDNFAMGTMTIAAGADLTFVDIIDNDGQGQTASVEALYLQTLIFEAGATVTIDNCKIYVLALIDNMVTPVLIGQGELFVISALPMFPPRAEAFGVGTCSADSDCLNLATCIEGQCYVPRNRYVSLMHHPLNAGRFTARRISLDTNGNASYDAGVDIVLGWVGAPSEVVVTGPEPSPQLMARVVAAPLYMDWSTAGAGGATVHLGDCHVSPGRNYLIQSIEQGSDIGEEGSYSAALALPTVGVWGDAMGSGNPATPPNGTANVGDMQAIVLGFQALQSAPKVWLDLDGSGNPDNVPDFGTINVADLQRAVHGFQGVAYPFSDPCTCAGLAPCP